LTASNPGERDDSATTKQAGSWGSRFLGRMSLRRKHSPTDRGAEPSSTDSGDPTGQSIDYINWGLRLAAQEKTDRACEKFRCAVERAPEDPMAHYDLALALQRLGRHTEAVEHYIMAAGLDPASVDVRVNLGAALIESADPVRAIHELEKAARHAPDDHLAQFNLGCAYLAIGDGRSAVSAFRGAVRCDPQDPQTRFNLAMALRKAGCPDLAEIELREFIALAGDDFPNHRVLAERLIAEEHEGDDDPQTRRPNEQP